MDAIDDGMVHLNRKGHRPTFACREELSPGDSRDAVVGVIHENVRGARPHREGGMHDVVLHELFAVNSLAKLLDLVGDLGQQEDDGRRRLERMPPGSRKPRADFDVRADVEVWVVHLAKELEVAPSMGVGDLYRTHTLIIEHRSSEVDEIWVFEGDRRPHLAGHLSSQCMLSSTECLVS